MTKQQTMSFVTVSSFAAFGAFALLPLWSGSLSPTAYEGGRSRNVEARAVRNTSSVAVMLGEVRTAMSDVMFIKSERYLHSGVAFVPHMEEEVLSVSGAMAHAEEHQAEVGQTDEPGEEAEQHRTIIRTADEDFRGFIGHLERQVKPYQEPGDPHTHTDGTELLPWFRVMTVSDPHYVPGYTTGAFWLKSRRPDEALAFVDEGIRNNPDAFQIHFAKGQILIDMARNAGTESGVNARHREALLSFSRAGELAGAQWRQAGMDPEATDYRTEDARASLRMHALMEARFGDPGEAARLARTYLALIGEDAALSRLVGAAGT